MGIGLQDTKGERLMNCFMCKGQLEQSTTDHVVKLKNCIIIVKHVPCERCKQCGETYYNDEVAEQLERIVDKVKAVATEIAVVNYPGRVA